MADSIDGKQLADAIVRWRKRRNWTQAETAKAAGDMPVNTLARLERGEFGFTVNSINRIAEAFNVPASFLTVAGTDASTQGECSELIRQLQEKIERIMSRGAPMDRESLTERLGAGEEFEFMFFWGHQPSKDGSVTKSCFSQWYESPFTVDGNLYATAEHWMMAEKARLFGDLEILPEILAADSPKTAKALGRKVKGFDTARWKANCRAIVTEGNVQKFGQNEDLKQFLLRTGNIVLVEASPRDRIWGIGMGASNENASNPAKWRGQNLLGFALMDVRSELSAN